MPGEGQSSEWEKLGGSTKPEHGRKGSRAGLAAWDREIMDTFGEDYEDMTKHFGSVVLADNIEVNGEAVVPRPSAEKIAHFAAGLYPPRLIA